MIKELQLSVYPATVVLLTDSDVAQKFYNAFGLQYDPENYAFVESLQSEQGQFWVLAFRNYDIALDDRILAHELIHLKNRIFNNLGHKQDPLNDETEAYFYMYLFDLFKHVIRHGEAEEINLESDLPAIVHGVKSDTV